jgi:transketolase N-terminal domain/subunit
MAYSSKYFDKINNRYYVILGDAETQEGSIWEAANFASHYKLDNVCAFVDCNRFGQSNIMDVTIYYYFSTLNKFWIVTKPDGKLLDGMPLLLMDIISKIL